MPFTGTATKRPPAMSDSTASRLSTLAPSPPAAADFSVVVDASTASGAIDTGATPGQGGRQRGLERVAGARARLAQQQRRLGQDRRGQWTATARPRMGGCDHDRQLVAADHRGPQPDHAARRLDEAELDVAVGHRAWRR